MCVIGTLYITCLCPTSDNEAHSGRWRWMLERKRKPDYGRAGARRRRCRSGRSAGTGDGSRLGRTVFFGLFSRLFGTGALVPFLLLFLILL